MENIDTVNLFLIGICFLDAARFNDRYPNDLSSATPAGAVNKGIPDKNVRRRSGCG